MHLIKTIKWPITLSKIQWLRLDLWQRQIHVALAKPRLNSPKTQTSMFSKSTWVRTIIAHQLLSTFLGVHIKNDQVSSIKVTPLPREPNPMAQPLRARNSKFIQFSKVLKRTRYIILQFQFLLGQMLQNSTRRPWWTAVRLLRKINLWWLLKIH